MSHALEPVSYLLERARETHGQYMRSVDFPGLTVVPRERIRAVEPRMLVMSRINVHSSFLIWMCDCNGAEEEALVAFAELMDDIPMRSDAAELHACYGVTFEALSRPRIQVSSLRAVGRAVFETFNMRRYDPSGIEIAALQCEVRIDECCKFLEGVSLSPSELVGALKFAKGMHKNATVGRSRFGVCVGRLAARVAAITGKNEGGSAWH